MAASRYRDGLITTQRVANYSHGMILAELEVCHVCHFFRKSHWDPPGWVIPCEAVTHVRSGEVGFTDLTPGRGIYLGEPVGPTYGGK